MSRIGYTPIEIPEKLKVSITKDSVTVSGDKGELSCKIRPGIKVKKKDNKILVDREGDDKQTKSFHGLTASLINNMLVGLTKGYTKELQVIGTGYSAEVVGPWLKLNVGYAHDILLEIPELIEVKAEAVPRREQGHLGVQAKITVHGIMKELVGKFAAEIKKCRVPLNYATGKGIRFKGEYVRIKPGKTAATA